MEETTTIKKGYAGRLWTVLDGTLLATVFCLLGYASFGLTHRTPAFQAELPRRAPQPEAPEPEQEPPARRPAGEAIEGIRVSQRAPVDRIAADMAASDWNAAPSSPAMDMRESGRSYEICFSLPENIDPATVNVGAAGHVLTLAMKRQNGRKLMQRFLIPCGVDPGDGHVQSFVTNGILRIRITP